MGQQPFILGLTGGIGMGKSTVSDMLSSIGVTVIDSDQIVHTLYAPGGAAVGEIEKEFPNAIKLGSDSPSADSSNEQTKSVDRRALSAYLSESPEKFAILEAIVHPLVKQEKLRQIDAAAQRGESIVVLDIPLLFETKSEDMCDAVMVVSAPASVQKSRVLSRPGMTEDRYALIVQRQMNEEERRKRADFIVRTDVPMEETKNHVMSILNGIKGRRGGIIRDNAKND
ncbi:Dephospho-CoA kinase [Picochlorum sp. SENEW3]|nr:Dephospho-CoA kinase [Picochlorum sp. SENEW3]